MSHMKKTQLYITRVNMMRKLPLSRVVVTKQKEDSRVHLQHRSGPFKA
jgi:predicted membrane-bound spermidine synthase